MIELTKHIEILLLENDCVIVPGLGGFIAHYQPAHYEEDECVFVPPTRMVGFNPQLTMGCWLRHTCKPIIPIFQMPLK